MIVDRFIDRLSFENREDAIAKTRTFEFLLALHILCEAWNTALRLQRAGAPWEAMSVFETTLASAGFAAWLRPAWRRWGLWTLVAAVGVRIARSFPMTGNHNPLLAICAAVHALFDPEDDDERKWRLGAVKAYFVFLVFHAGAQKLVHGHYFRGEFFAFYVAHSPPYRDFFRWFLPPDEIARLASYGFQVGDGPYRLESWIGLAISNSTWISEMALPWALLFPKLRPWAVFALFVFLLGIEAAAREFYFGIFFFNALLLFASARTQRATVPIAVAFYVWMLWTVAGVLPQVNFH